MLYKHTQSQGGKSVHDQVDPEKLHSSEDRVFTITGNSGDESEDDCGDIDRDLELDMT